ncbi:anhydro-N-acetylmuramic acid kinase [Gryllotalpicola sp.]|uniref:anhydro-N-acetylmuramic acid kinase n=1 Tax=Gryllotalpicola sp. TaxID=1932787 RepID=UPI0026272333|nr:anhydro-N-acetylmuramic acid kinase [Gryllotalpicola sp.]
MRILGMISGTSHDGIDIAVVDFTEDGEKLTGSVEYTDSIPYDADLRSSLLQALPPSRVGFETVCELDTRIGQAFAAAAHNALEAHAALPWSGPVDAICSHGQTVFHWVDDGHALGTLQLGQAAWIAEMTALPVISDVRAADIAVGGQGAPLVPILDQLILSPARAAGQRAGALNLGGIANVTVCAPGHAPVAWDIGPANALIDAVVTASPVTDDTFDRDGALAGAGVVDQRLLQTLLEEPYYALPAPKSSGKELFHHDHVTAAIARAGVDPRLPDIVATLTELTAVTVADAIRAARLDLLVVSGGGLHNPVLMERINALLPEVQVIASDVLGVPADDKEAIAFALIGWATLHGLPGNVPSCTGATAPRVLGRLTPAPTGGFPPLIRSPQWPTGLTVVPVADAG